jgi:hypothetical protein
MLSTCSLTPCSFRWFSQISSHSAVFFSHNKPANSIFSHNKPAKRTGSKLLVALKKNFGVAVIMVHGLRGRRTSIRGCLVGGVKV